MAPLIAQLLASGVSLLGNVLLDKGKDEVEKRLGVKLPDLDQPATPEKIAELRALEFAHEERLLELSIAQRAQDLEADKLAYADTASAREREAKVAATDAPVLVKLIVPLLALLVVVGGGLLLWQGSQDVKLAAASLMATVLGYYFGSSDGSKRKQATIERLMP